MTKRTTTAAVTTLWNWQKEGSLVYGNVEYQPSAKVLGFDMDCTLINTKSGAKFAKDAKDWKWWSPNVIAMIKEYHGNGFSIVIFTNQNGIAKGHTKESDIKQKIEDMQAEMKVPLAALIASSDDIYRKPRTEMWSFFTSKVNNNINADLAQSIYCGDAAGRATGNYKDFTDSDLKFALNIGIQFKTPEQLFLKKDLGDDYSKNVGFNPKTISKAGPIFAGDAATTFTKPDKPEIILLMGSPGAGKSTFVENHLKDYVRVNRDTLKTKEKCFKVAEEAVAKNQYVVIDNTNPTADDRAPYIKIAAKHKYPIRAFYLNVTKDLAFHNDTQRDANKHRQHFSKRAGTIPVHTFFKNCQPPTTAEGFSEVKTINFIAGPFKNPLDEQTFFSFVKSK